MNLPWSIKKGFLSSWKLHIAIFGQTAGAPKRHWWGKLGLGLNEVYNTNEVDDSNERSCSTDY